MRVARRPVEPRFSGHMTWAESAGITRINRQWRVCFRWDSDGPYDVEVVDYH